MRTNGDKLGDVVLSQGAIPFALGDFPVGTFRQERVNLIELTLQTLRDGQCVRMHAVDDHQRSFGYRTFRDGGFGFFGRNLKKLSDTSQRIGRISSDLLLGVLQESLILI